MPSIRLSNNANAEILTADAGPGSGFSKYFHGDVAGFLASSELEAALGRPIATLASSPLGLGLTLQAAGSFGTSTAEWKLQAGARVTARATQAGQSLPGDDVFGDPPAVPDGHTAVSLTFTPSLSIAASGAVGDLSFGFSAGGSVDFTAGRSFDVTDGHVPTLGEALADLFTTGVVPGDLADAQAMRPGDVGSVSGMGQFHASASFDLAAALNPLATPTLGLEQIGALELKAGASLNVGASIGVSGRYRIRVEKIDPNRVRVSYFKMRGSQFEFDVTASVGVSATLGKRDLIDLFSRLSSAPQADVTQLVESGLSDAQIEDIKAAITASLNRSLSLSLAASFGAETQRTAVFEYEFTLDALGPAGIAAFHAALDGNLSPLTSIANGTLPAGVRLIHNQLDTIKTRTTTWRINLFGIVNILKLTELIRKGTVLFDEETGDLLITDAITGKRLTIDARPHAAAPAKLRQIVMQSMVLTAAYRASGLQRFLAFQGSMSYFEQRARAGRREISDFLDNFAGLSLIDTSEKAGFLTGPFAGAASVFAELTFDNGSFDAMFIDAAGRPLTQEAYDAIGRRAVAQLVQPGDEQEFRRIPMTAEGDALWRQMTDLGQFAMRAVMPPALRGDLPFALVVHDYTVIRWWSKAMSTAAKRVVDMKQFLAAAGGDAVSLRDNNEFKKKRASLEKALADVVSEAQPGMLDAWGLLVMDAAAQHRTGARGILVTQAAVLVKNRA